MRKIFFLLISSACFLACNNSKDGRLNANDSTDKDNDMSGRSAELHDFPVLDSGKAKQMIRHYMDENVDHKLNSIIKSIAFEKKELTNMLDMKHVVGIKFLTAAYLDKDPRKNMPTIVMQVKKKHDRDSSYAYYDVNIQSFRTVKSVLCPPPEECYGNIEN